MTGHDDAWPQRLLAQPENLRTRGRAVVLAAAGVVLLLVAWLDNRVLQEISFSVFYLFPVAAAAWHGGRVAGLTFALSGAVLWAVCDRSSGQVYSHWAIPYWNTLVRLIYFATVADLLARLRRLLIQEREAADVDMLTGVFNRAGWFEAAEIELARARRNAEPVSVAYIDLDDFKKVNDSAGHAAGDSVLVEVGSVLRTSVRRSDVVGRFGGDEFAVLLPRASAEDANTLCDKLHRALAAAMGRHGWPVGFSVGIAAFEQPPADVQTLVSRADDAMYVTKRRRKQGLALVRPAAGGWNDGWG